MAKQRRARARGQSPKVSHRVTREPERASGHQQQAPPPAPSAPPPPPSRSTSYFEAVTLYERGIEALQRHDYRAALERLEAVLRQYPEEKELVERARLFLKVCARHAAPQQKTPETVEERLYAATLAINGGALDEAIRHLRLVRDEDPDNDHALYMLAVAHAQRQEHAEAVAHLERAIALNPENRTLARRDPDLDPLRDNEAFRAALEAPHAPPRNDRRRPVRGKTGR